MSKRVRHVHLQCHCDHPDHVVRVTLDTSENPPEVSIMPMLNPQPSLWRRIWVAFRYVFGLKSKDSHWGSYQFDSVLLSNSEVQELSNLLVHRKIIQKLRQKKSDSE